MCVCMCLYLCHHLHVLLLQNIETMLSHMGQVFKMEIEEGQFFLSLLQNVTTLNVQPENILKEMTACFS